MGSSVSSVEKKYEILQMRLHTRAAQVGNEIFAIKRNVGAFVCDSVGAFVCDSVVFDKRRLVYDVKDARYRYVYCVSDNHIMIYSWGLFHSFCITRDRNCYLVNKEVIFVLSSTGITTLKLNLSSAFDSIFKNCFRILTFLSDSNGKYAYACLTSLNIFGGCLVKINLKTGHTIRMISKYGSSETIRHTIRMISKYGSSETISLIVWDTHTTIPESVLWTFDTIRPLERIMLPLTFDQIWNYILIPDNIITINLISNLWSIVAEYLPLYYFHDPKYNYNQYDPKYNYDQYQFNTTDSDAELIEITNDISARSITYLLNTIESQKNHITGLVRTPSGKFLLGVYDGFYTYSRLYMFDPHDTNCNYREILLNCNIHHLTNFIWDQDNHTLLFSDRSGLLYIKLPHID